MKNLRLGKYSIGVGDRFAHEGKAQLGAVIEFSKQKKEVTPVWNKSYREHQITHTEPHSVREEADEAVRTLGWNSPYFVDADHINIKNVDLFIDSSDYFTIDVADFIGKEANPDELQTFVNKYSKHLVTINLPIINGTLEITKEKIESSARKYLRAIEEASKIYEIIKLKKGEGNFITELSFDETEKPQSPIEIFFILAGISDKNIPVQTIAPKFSGRFNKGIDYKGAIAKFANEFRQHLAVIAYAIDEFVLPKNLKLSIHSGSDKYSIYKHINESLKEFDAGIHVKTAGTTWLEELTGLALTEDRGLTTVKNIYKNANQRIEELSKPYQEVIDINRNKLPTYKEVSKWGGNDFANALKNDPSCNKYNEDFRQLLHVSYKLAAEMGGEYTELLVQFKDTIHENVKNNIYSHLKAIFG